MALVNTISFQITDFAGGVKSMTVYFPATATAAEMAEFVTDFSPLLDEVIDGKITAATVTTQATLPGGLKADPVSGNTVHEGALLSYDAADTVYTHSVFVPSWENAGFSGDTVLATGDYDAVQDAFVSGAVDDAPFPSDRYANDLTSYSGGVRKFRK